MSRRTADGKLWWKIDFHIHTAEDPLDSIEHSASDLLCRAHELAFDAIAITLHQQVLYRPELFELARSLGILLLPAIEFRISKADVVAVHITPDEAGPIRTFADLRAFKAKRGRDLLTFIPHPFYVLGGSIGDRAHAEMDCFDAVEYCHFHTLGLNPNRRAVALAQRYAKPLLATSDSHRLDRFGGHYSWVQVPENATPSDLFDAIRQDRIERVSPPWPLPKMIAYLAHIFLRERIQEALQKCQE
jgi:predicted metal-dependent phosphoesterase TrpH